MFLPSYWRSLIWTTTAFRLLYTVAILVVLVMNLNVRAEIDQVSDGADPAGGPLPMLESEGYTHRVWHLLPAHTENPLDGIALRPGASVVIYPTPPVPPTEEALDALLGQVRVGPCVALVVDADGSLHFDRLRSVDDIPAWRARARSSRACAVFPVNQSGAWVGAER